MKTTLYIKVFVCLFCIVLVNKTFAQNVGITASGSFTPDASAGLDVSFTNKGLLVPRVALTATNAAGPITSPATSLLVYNTATAGTSPNNVVPGYYYWNGAAWSMLSTSTQTNANWSTTGNAGTTAGTNFIGTTDAKDFVFKTNNTEAARFTSGGSLTIGNNTTPDATNPEKLLVDAGTTTSFNGLVVKGSIDNYFQMNVKNQSTGATATSDIVATANNGTETSNYVDLGINGSGYTGSNIQTGKANDGYLISAGNDFYLVNSTPNKSMLFLTGGTGVAQERMRILSNGRVGMGVQDPTSQFVVKDTMEIRRTGPLSQLLFTNTSGSGDLRIAGDGGDLFWQGGGSRALQMGSFWTTILGGDRQTTTYPAYVSSLGGTGVLVQSQRNASVPLGVQAFSGSQSANLTEWRNSAGTVLSTITKDGNLGIGITTPATKLHVFGANPLTLSGVVTGTSTSADSLLTITNGLVRKLPISGFASPASWSTTGNAGTTAGTNFLGTTDATDMVFKTSGNERMRIVDAANSTTGTTGDIVVGSANSGTLRANKELVMRQDGDTFGPSTMRLRNRSGQNGVVFETTGGSANLVDFSFNTGTVSSPISSNIRFETRPGSIKVAGNTTEWQFGQPDTNNGGPTLIVGASGNGSNSAIRTGNFAVGNIAFNSANPEKLLVDAGTNASYNVISGRGNLNNYLQLNIQNTNAGTTASSDVVATADNGSETANYVDMGINSSANTAAFFGAANDAYLYNSGGTVGGNFFIGTSTSGKALGFMTGGGATTNERMRIDGTGNVGIGITTPATKLHVFGANPLTLSGVVTGTSTSADSLLTITNGLVRKLPISGFASPASWSTTGNAGTTAGTNFIGTTDAVDFVIKTGGTERARFTNTGDVSIGGTAFNSTNPEQLLVDAGTTSSYNVINGKGSINNYLQLNIQNTNAGTAASSDVVATADNGSETANYIDMGINSSGNTAAFFGGINDAYLYNTGGTAAGGNLFIGTSTSGKALGFMTGGGATTNERMRIDGNGNVGIGTTTPAQKLDVRGTIVSSATTYPNYAYNTANRMAFGETVVPGNETGSVVQYGSGSGTRNMVFAFSKTTINTSFLGNDGTQTMLGSEGTSNPITFKTGLAYNAANIIGSGTEVMRITAGGNVGIGTTGPTATLHLKAGTATANTSPLKFTSGTLLTTAETGAVEFDGTNYFATSGTVRYTLAKTLTATQTLDFPSTLANTSSNLTITVTGAADGDVVSVGAPNGSVVANSSYTAYVSAANTVTVKFVNSSTAAIDPASGTFRVSVLKY